MAQAMILKLAHGATLPTYTRLRAHIAADIFTVDVEEADLHLLDSDPAVLSYEFPRKTHLTKGDT